MTALIELPGVLTSTAGLEPVITTVAGFPDQDLADLYLFADAAGTAITNRIAGGQAGLIEQLSAGDHGSAYQWLPGGGLELTGTYMATLAEFRPDQPWTMVYAGAITGHVSESAEAITSLLAFRDRAGPSVRGPVLLARSFHAGGESGFYGVRAWQGTADGAATNFGSGAGIVNRHRVAILSYNGADTVSGALYDKHGNLLAATSVAAGDTGMTTNNGSTLEFVKMAIGLSNSVYDGGVQRIEAAARYDRVLTPSDIAAICSAAAALGASRGRPW